MESPDEEGLLCQELPELMLSLSEVPLELVQLRHHEPPLHLAGLGVTQPPRVPQRPAPIRAPHLSVQSALERVHVGRIAAQNCRIHSRLLILLFDFLELLDRRGSGGDGGECAHAGEGEEAGDEREEEGPRGGDDGREDALGRGLLQGGGGEGGDLGGARRFEMNSEAVGLEGDGQGGAGGALAVDGEEGCGG